MSAIHPKITEVLTHTFKVPAAEIHPDSTMDSLEMDSLAVAEFAVLIRESTGGRGDFDRLPKEATLTDITRFIDAAVGGRVSADGRASMSPTR
ncbi:acyl carrier protein [Streptomyces sp. NPDC052052]|uniref:acyl carrier protein n=1 Tax=Streptomyces sp. NPDC052052 TaxID=3154756 RepID=UPI003433E597